MIRHMRFPWAFLCGLAMASPSAAAPGDLVWKVATGAPIWSPITHADGRLYFGNEAGLIHAIDLASRTSVWTFATGGPVRSQPAVAGALVYAASDDGYLYAVDRASGAEKWRFDLRAKGLTRRPPSPDNPFYDFLQSSPLVHDGRVYVGSINGMLFAVDALTGREIWKVGTADSVRGSPRLEGASLYFASWDDHLYSVDLANGKVNWRADTGGIIQSTPAIGAGHVVVGSRSGALVAFDAATGKEAWRYTLPDGSWVESSPVYRDGIFYVGSSDALSVSAIRAKDGTKLWESRLGGWAWSTPRLSGESLYIGTASALPYYFEGVTLTHGFHALDVRTGAERWRFVPQAAEGYLTGGVVAAPEIVDDTVYLGALDGYLYALEE